MSETPRKRCQVLDALGCRCLRPFHRDGPHDFSYTVWADVQKAARLLALKGRGK